MCVFSFVMLFVCVQSYCFNRKMDDSIIQAIRKKKKNTMISCISGWECFSAMTLIVLTSSSPLCSQTRWIC